MTHLMHKVSAIQNGNHTSENDNSLLEAQEAIKKSREILDQAEQAVSRSYAVVELSKNYLDNLSEVISSKPM